MEETANSSTKVYDHSGRDVTVYLTQPAGLPRSKLSQAKMVKCLKYKYTVDKNENGEVIGGTIKCAASIFRKYDRLNDSTEENESCESKESYEPSKHSKTKPKCDVLNKKQIYSRASERFVQNPHEFVVDFSLLKKVKEDVSITVTRKNGTVINKKAYVTKKVPMPIEEQVLEYAMRKMFVDGAYNKEKNKTNSSSSSSESTA
jgi:hypothetical protein